MRYNKWNLRIRELASQVINGGTRFAVRFFHCNNHLPYPELLFPLFPKPRNLSSFSLQWTHTYFLWYIPNLPSLLYPSLNFNITYYPYIVLVFTFLSLLTRIKIPRLQETYLIFNFIPFRYNSPTQTQHIIYPQ